MTLSFSFFKDFVLYGLSIALAFLLLIPFQRRTLISDPNKPDHAPVRDKRENSSSGRDDTATNTATSRTTTNIIMQAPREDLFPPKDDPFTLEELKAFDGSDASKPVYVAIKGALSSSSLPLPLSFHPNSYVPTAQERYLTCRGSARRTGPAVPTRSSLARMVRAGSDCRVSSPRMPYQIGAHSRRRTARRLTTGMHSSRASLFHPLILLPPLICDWMLTFVRPSVSWSFFTPL